MHLFVKLLFIKVCGQRLPSVYQAAQFLFGCLDLRVNQLFSEGGVRFVVDHRSDKRVTELYDFKTCKLANLYQSELTKSLKIEEGMS